MRALEAAGQWAMRSASFPTAARRWPATALSWVATSCITLQPVGAQELLDGGFLHGEAMTVTGKTVAENLAGVKALSHPDLQALPCCLQAAL